MIQALEYIQFPLLKFSFLRVDVHFLHCKPDSIIAFFLNYSDHSIFALAQHLANMVKIVGPLRGHQPFEHSLGAVGRDGVNSFKLIAR